MVINKKNISVLLLSLVFITSTYAQDKPTKDKKDKATKEKKVKAKPIKKTFGALTQINSQTVDVMGKKSLLFEIQHRFGQFNQQKEKDLYGIFGAANVRMGLNYGITKNLTVGIGGTKANHLYNAQVKYKILAQTKTNSMPITLTYFADARINTSEDPNFKKQSNRMSYFNELMLARKFGKKTSVQLGYSYTHFNLIDTIGFPDLRHDNFNISFLGRYNFSAQSSVIVEFNQPYTVLGSSVIEFNKPNVGVGIEIATGGHAFQIFITSAGFINKENISEYNQSSDFTKDDLRLGFNISRKWRF